MSAGDGCGRVERLWPGATVVCIGSGPSLTQAQVDYCRGKARAIVINTTWEKAQWADVLYVSDSDWWNQYDGLSRFEGLKYSQDDCVLAYPTVRHIVSVDKSGLSFNRATIHQGGNGGYQAVNLAVHFGVKRIILLGYDMKDGPEGQKHHHADHPGEMNNPNPGNYARWIAAFETLPPDLEKADVEVINCTPGSALECFPMAKLEDVL